MTFPVYLHLGPWTLHPHPVFEFLAYFIGFRVYLYTRNKDRIPVQHAISVLVGATVGAALGSKLLAWFEDPVTTVHDLLTNPLALMGGKTIVGGLLGGLIGVELAKKLIGWSRSTGDDFALPLLTGMAIGRIGCFLTGLPDHTYGSPTGWITGVDFGDGIPRHPAQLYEIGFLLVLGVLLFAAKRGKLALYRNAPEGAVFQTFMFGYLLFRLAIDFMKPTLHPYIGLNNVQVACLLGLVYYAMLMRRWTFARHAQPAAPAEGKDNHA